MLLAFASLLALFVQETRTETWPGGSKKAEYQVECDAQGIEVKHGKFRSWFEDGTLASEGAFAQGKETGPWVLYHADGTKAAAGSYADGLKSGPWETAFPGGKPESKGGFVRGAMDGRWTFWREDGTKDNVASGIYKLEVHRSKETARHYRGYFVDNVRQGTWTSYWPDRSVQFEGGFVAGKREGPWVFRHQDGTPSSLLLSGEYAAGAWAGPLAGLESAPIDLARLPGPEPYLTGWPSERDTLAGLLRRELQTLTLDESARRTFARAGVQGLPVVLEVWRTLDPETEGGRRALGFVEHELLRPLCSGHALSRHGPAGPPDAASARELLRAWLSLWALTRLDSAFWEVDVPGPSRAGVGLRDLLQDPPLLERDARYAPSAARATAAGASADAAAEPRSEFRARFGRPKAENQRRMPAGTAEALERALAWLAAHQASDGHWSNDHFETACGRVGKGACTGQGGAAHDVGATGLALLAFLGDGHTPTLGDHRETVARGLAWLAQRQDGQGLIGERASHDFFYDHLIATAALCEGVGLGAEALRSPAEKGIAFLLLGRHPEGAWRYDVPAGEKGDTSMTGWAVNALVAAQRAGLEVDPAALAASLAWFDAVTEPRSGRTGYVNRGELSVRTPANEEFPRELGEALTGVSLLSRILLGQRPASTPILHEQAKLIAARPPEVDPRGNDLYYWYYGTHALWQMGAPYWDSWAKDLRNALVLVQSKRGDELGSWDPIGPWGYVMGRVCSTALAALTLECCTRYPRYLESGR